MNSSTRQERGRGRKKQHNNPRPPSPSSREPSRGLSNTGPDGGSYVESGGRDCDVEGQRGREEARNARGEGERSRGGKKQHNNPRPLSPRGREPSRSLSNTGSDGGSYVESGGRDCDGEGQRGRGEAPNARGKGGLCDIRSIPWSLGTFCAAALRILAHGDGKVKAKIIGRGGLTPLLKLCDPVELPSDEMGDA